jgi:endonuclease/exonuclease/phosphatase family metal-dependent hydrolase
MKNIIKLLLTVIGSLLVCIVILFFWAQQSCLNPKDYTKVKKHNHLPTTTDSTLLVASYNIGYLSGMTNNKAIRAEDFLYNKNLNSAIKHLKNLNADILAFQEIDFNSQRSYHVNQNTVISDSLFAYSASAVNWDKKYVPFPYWPISVQFGEMLSGQSVVSKYKIENNERIVLQKVKDKPFYYNSFYLDRLAQVVEVKHPVKDITVINIHVEAFEQKTRIAQLKNVLELAKEKAKKGAVILLGDFNSDPGYKNAACQMFLNDDVFVLTDTIAGTHYKKTYPSAKPSVRLDYIFYTKKDFISEKSDVLNDFGLISDHLPVYARLRFI